MREYIMTFEQIISLSAFASKYLPFVLPEITRCIECAHNSITDGTGIHCDIFKCFIGDLDFFCAWGVIRDTQE